jgi:membrane protein YqaA with SNARE-associated domain
VPLVGDVLVIIAGWLRLNAWHCLLWIALGKAARYAVLAVAVLPVT